MVCPSIGPRILRWEERQVNEDRQGEPNVNVSWRKIVFTLVTTRLQVKSACSHQSWHSGFALELLPVSEFAQPAPTKTRRWTNSKAAAIAELAAVGLIFAADFYHWHHLILVSKTPYILLFAWLSLRVRGQKWRSLGWGLYRSWAVTLTLGVLFGLANELLELFVTQPLLVHFFHRWPDLSDLRPLVGNSKMLLVALVLTWTLAAFGEELVYRGYLMNRVADLFGRTRLAWTVSLILTVTSIRVRLGRSRM